MKDRNTVWHERRKHRLARETEGRMHALSKKTGMKKTGMSTLEQHFKQEKKKRIEKLQAQSLVL